MAGDMLTSRPVRQHLHNTEASSLMSPSAPVPSDVVLSSGRRPVPVRWLSQCRERELREIQALRHGRL